MLLCCFAPWTPCSQREFYGTPCALTLVFKNVGLFLYIIAYEPFKKTNGTGACPYPYYTGEKFLWSCQVSAWVAGFTGEHDSMARDNIMCML